MAASLLFKRAARAPALLGGEWGGWCCVFDAQTGIVKPIPDKYCSETAIAWGQIPLGFEELHTESFSAIGYLDGSERMTTDVRIGGGPEPMRRRRVQVHPADGCGGDSLPGAVTRSLLVTPRSSGALELHANNATASAHVDAWAIDTRIDGHPSTWRIETILQASAEDERPRLSTPFRRSVSGRAYRSSSTHRPASWQLKRRIRRRRTRRRSRSWRSGKSAVGAKTRLWR